MFKLTEPVRWPDALATMATKVAVKLRYRDHGNAVVHLEMKYGHVESVLDSLGHFVRRIGHSGDAARRALNGII